jgi:HD-like signal output (HDOD) protein
MEGSGVTGGERLPERVLIALYNMGKVLKLQPGEQLIPGHEKGVGVFLVMRGLLRVCRGGAEPFREVTLFDNFDWLAPGIVGASGAPGYIVMAEEPSQVLALEETTLATLEPPLQRYILGKVIQSCVQRLRGIELEAGHSATVNRYLRGVILDVRARHCAGYESSELITGLLRSLPRLPAYSLQLIRILDQEGASHREVTRLVKEDPSLVSQLLKVINSPYYGLRKKVSDLNYAVLYLGFNQIHQLMLSTGLRQVMPHTDEFQELHHHSVLLSHLAYEVCQFHDRRKASILSTIGLLHDIGQSVSLLLRAQNPRWSLFVDMLDTARIGAMLLKEWGIPSMIHETIDSQGLLDFTPPGLADTPHREAVALLHATHAACAVLQGRMDILEHPFLEEIREFLQLPGESFRDFVEGHLLRELSGKQHTLPRHLRELLATIGPQASDP